MIVDKLNNNYSNYLDKYLLYLYFDATASKNTKRILQYTNVGVMTLSPDA